MSPARYTVTCTLCKHVFIHKALHVPPMPEPIGDRVKALVMELAKHMHRKHTRELGAIEAAVQDFYGFALLTLFEQTDQTLAARLEQTRSTIHNATTPQETTRG